MVVEIPAPVAEEAAVEAVDGAMVVAVVIKTITAEVTEEAVGLALVEDRTEVVALLEEVIAVKIKLLGPPLKIQEPLPHEVLEPANEKTGRDGMLKHSLSQLVDRKNSNVDRISPKSNYLRLLRKTSDSLLAL